MDRPILYSQEQVRSYDLLKGFLDVEFALGALLKSVVNYPDQLISGFVAQATGSMNINFTAGRLLSPGVIDPSAYGSLTLSGVTGLRVATTPESTINFPSGDLVPGQVRWSLVELDFQQVDSYPTDDPTKGLLMYYNPTTPTSPYLGQGNSGITQRTRRRDTALVKVITSLPGVLGEIEPPTPDVGFAPAYLILVAAGQQVITKENIFKAGPSVAPGVPDTYPVAPFLTGFTQQHHTGVLGQAPKIVLTDFAEVTGELPVDMLPPKVSGKVNIAAINIFAGPTSGAPVTPNFRKLIPDDMPAVGVEVANTVYAGPESGGAQVPDFRALVADDFSGISRGISAVFLTNGTWVCPAGVNLVIVSLCGGGAGGTAGTRGSIRSDVYTHETMEFIVTQGQDGNGAGAAGGIYHQPVQVIPGQSYQIIIGKGGASNTAGGDTFFGSLLSAKGGTPNSGGASPLLYPNGQAPTNLNGGKSLLSPYGDGGKGGAGGTVTNELLGVNSGFNGTVYGPPGQSWRYASNAPGSSGKDGIVIIFW